MRTTLYQAPAKPSSGVKTRARASRRRRALDPMRAQQMMTDAANFEREMTRGRRRGR